VFGERARRRCFLVGRKEWLRGKEEEESKTPGMEEGGWKRRVPHLGYAQVPLYHISTQLASHVWWRSGLTVHVHDERVE
jgi:hypothetical protein